ncbi:transcriptional regulator [Brevibacterium sp. ACRRH]|uniref:transcriptional regulator n=1 Tax=Brevibacterium sp. ACRRH TaxID=2918183 RepID=UPI001EF52F77|nr:transcriptional regulator [Brevibacterium sp. ACRRH]MCG7299529.1 transcriptional regulator [Brevibacterium sp. ACRRH]
MTTHALEQLSPLLSNPTRLALVAGLDGCVKSDFQTIKQQLSVTDSTLSKHITALEKEGLVDVKKGFVGKKTKTTLSLSKKGREVFAAHMQGLKEIARMSFDEEE